jgi:hypothetical protein
MGDDLAGVEMAKVSKFMGMNIVLAAPEVP